MGKERRLLFREKQELERLIKCERTTKRSDILTKLYKEKDELIKPFNDKIRNLEAERDKKLKIACLDNLNEGCGISRHSKLKEFDAETNKLLKELWDKRD